jgi:hypothetical protein
LVDPNGQPLPAPSVPGLTGDHPATEGLNHPSSPLLDAGPFASIWNPDVGRMPLRASYRVTWFADEPVAGQFTNLGYVQQDLSFAFPLWHNGTCDDLSATINVRNETFHTLAILPDTLQPFPQDLWNIRFGLTYRHQFDNGWITGGTVSLGSASDQPFHSINEMTAGISAFLRVPSGEHNAWLFSLHYSPTSDLPIPIPGVAFVWQPTENFRANIGLPFQIMWRPIEDLTLDVSYMLLTTFHARANYRLCRPLRVYVGYASENESYFLADRTDYNLRFFNIDQRVTAGVQYFFNPKTSLDFSTGYVFDHYFFEGKNITNGTHFNRIDVGDGPYVSLQLQIRW